MHIAHLSSTPRQDLTDEDGITTRNYLVRRQRYNLRAYVEQFGWDAAAPGLPAESLGRRKGLQVEAEQLRRPSRGRRMTHAMLPCCKTAT